MQELAGFDIRYTTEEDVKYLREWIAHPDVLCWFSMADQQEIESALQCWIGYSRYKCSLTATIDQEPCGIATLFLMPYKKVAHHCLFKVVVDPKWQRKGIGFSLIKNIKHLAKTYFRLETIHIEVFEGNALISLLKEKLGFYEVVRQDRYVKMGDTYLARVLLETEL